MTDEAPTPDEAPKIVLSEADQIVLDKWFEHLLLLDPRYDDKRVRQIGARAMTDEGFRRRIAGDTATTTEEENAESPAEVDVRFFTNTSTTLNVVLPPKSGESEKYPARIRDALRSRTSESAALFQDDWFDNDPDHYDHGTDGTDTWDSSVAVELKMQ